LIVYARNLLAAAFAASGGAGLANVVAMSLSSVSQTIAESEVVALELRSTSLSALRRE
jgi:Rod binding domain-containing protein